MSRAKCAWAMPWREMVGFIPKHVCAKQSNGQFGVEWQKEAVPIQTQPQYFVWATASVALHTSLDFFQYSQQMVPHFLYAWDVQTLFGGVYIAQGGTEGHHVEVGVSF